MSFKFTEIEGIDEELAEKLDGDEAIQNHIAEHIESSVNNRVDVAKAEFKKKMDAMDAKVKAAEEKLENAPDIDADELKVLREARDKNPELQATLDAMKQRTEDAENKLKAQEQELMAMQLNHTTIQAMNEYDAAHPSVSIKPDMKDVVQMLAQQSLRYDKESKSFRVYDNNGDIIATDKGAATPVDWLTKLRTERPSLFNAPTGSGAPGSRQNTGSAKKYSEMTEAERVALYREDRAKFNQIRGTEENGNNTPK